MELKDYGHPYYANDGNFYSNDSCQTWQTMAEFLDGYEDADVDMNMVFRWDIRPRDEQKTRWEAQVIIIGQRKGIYASHSILNVNADELIRFEKYLWKHWENMKMLWCPFSDT